MEKPLQVFCCYARNDEIYLEELKKHLTPLKRQDLISLKADVDIDPGMEREQEINHYLEKSQIILLLISSDFIASNYCYEYEMKQAMKRHELGEARIIPILLRPSIWQETPFGKLQALPKNARTVTEWRDRDKAWSAIAQEIEQIAKEWLTEPPEPPQSMLNATRLHLQSVAGKVHCDWGEAPDVPIFFGRTKELALLEQWITADRCRLVALVGMKGIGKTRLSVKLGRGGIGKTDLSLKLARGIQEQFDYIIWRSLLNAPKMSEILTDLIKFLSNQQEVHLSNEASEQILRFLHYLRQHRCLIILDNAETILQGGKQVGQYSPGYEGYGQLIERIADIPHQSCLLLTSREKIPEIAQRESQTGLVRSLEVRGLHYSDGKKIFAEVGSFSGSKEDWKQLNYLYNGNPLALELAARHIKEVFFGSVSEFLREGKPIFADLQSLLDWHFNRLSNAHKEVMYWLAINRKPTSLAELREDILLSAGKEQIPSTLHSLQRLIPLERGAKSFTLQPVLIEYMTQRLVERVVEELKSGEIDLFNTHALLKTSLSDYIRDIQSRLILKSVSEKLLEVYGKREGLEGRLCEILSLLRERFRFTSGYAGGNLLNLLCYLKVDVKGYNFSSLTVWHAYLRGMNVQEVNFTSANLAKSVFTDTFGSILCVALSPYGDLLAAATATGEIRLWQAASGLPLQTLRGHPDWVWSVAFSPDGKLLASGSDDQTVCLWEVSSGKLLNTLQGHTNTVSSLAFSSDGKTLASGSDDQTVRLWEVSSGKLLNTLRGHSHWVSSVAFSSDSKTFASGSDDQTVRLWEVGSGKLLNTLHGHTNVIESVAFSPDGKTLASGSEDRTVRLWDVGSGRQLNSLCGHSHRIWSVAFSPDGKTLASGSEDRTVRLWDIGSSECFNTLQGHTNTVSSVAFSSDGKTLASVSHDQTVRLWDVNSGQCLNTLRGHANPVRSVAFSPDSKTLASGNEDQTIRLWDVSSGQCLNTLHGHANVVKPVAFSSDGRILASGSNDQTVRLWDVNSGQCLNTLHGHSHWVSSVAFSPDGRTLASGGEDQTVYLWEVSSGQCLNTLHGHSHWISSLAFSPDGKILASGSGDHRVCLWEMSSSKLLNTLHGHANAVRSVVFSPDGKTLASGSGDQTICLWEVSSGQCLNTLHGHTSAVSSVAFSPDGRTLASGSYDQTIRLWEMSNGKLLNILHKHSHWISSVAFSPDGKIFASSSYDGAIHLCDGQTGLYLRTLRSDRPYERMNITQVKGLSEAQKAALKLLGAIENE